MVIFAQTAFAVCAAKVIHAVLCHCRCSAILMGIRQQECLTPLFSSQFGPFEQPFELPISRM